MRNTRMKKHLPLLLTLLCLLLALLFARLAKESPSSSQ